MTKSMTTNQDSVRSQNIRSRKLITLILTLTLIAITFAVLSSTTSFAATYYVAASSGNDSNIGTYSNPFKTIQHCADIANASDTCLVQAGYYNETISINRGGTPANRITFLANGTAITRRFNIRNSSIVIDGFTFANATGQYVGYIDTRDVADLSDLIMQNNIMLPGVYSISDNVTLTPINATQAIIDAPDGQFLTRGFDGRSFSMSCYELSNSSNQYWTNVLLDDTVNQTEMSVHALYYGNTSMPSGMTQAHCLIYVNAYGFEITATNFTIRNNTMDNLWGNFITFGGANGLVENNTLTNINGWDMFRPFGENHTIRYNFMKDSRLNWGNDNHADFFQTWSNDNTTISRNVIVEHNFVINAETQLCMEENGGLSPFMHNWTVRYNVFAMPMNESGMLTVQANLANYSPQYWYKNTFFRIGGTGGQGIVLSGTVDKVYDNAFIADADNANGMGWYGGSAAYADYNFVSNNPPLYTPKSSTCIQPNVSDGYNFCELHGINGGDPLVKSVDDILGPDGKPWTSDDGLIPLASSPLCNSASDGSDIGAYSCQGCVDTNPIAFYGVDALTGYSPMTVALNASHSLSCAATLTYNWNFGDGNTDNGINTTHTFATGTHQVTLNVTNNLGHSSTYTRTITTYPATEAGLIAWLPFDGTTTDISGRYHQFNWNANASYEAGVGGQATNNTPSQNDYVIAPYSADFDTATAMTISIWAKKHTPDASGDLINKHVTYLETLKPSAFQYYFSTAVSPGTSTSTVTVSNADTNWHHYLLVYNGSTTRFFFDGVLAQTQNSSGDVHVDQTREVTMGNGFGTFLNGSIDEFKMYNRAVSDSEIQTLYLRNYTAEQGEDIYIANISSGNDDGTNCANAHSTTWFNTAADWSVFVSNGDRKISPGDTVHLCGTISNPLSVQRSGLNNYPIKILFEQNAKMSAPTWNSPAIAVDNMNYITIDGGANGIIEATQSGTGLPYIFSSSGVSLVTTTYAEVKNLILRTLYVRTPYSNDNVSNQNGGGRGIDYSYANYVSIHNNTISDVNTGIGASYGAGMTNVSIYNNTISRTHWGINAGDWPANVGTLDNVTIYNNRISQGYAWDGILGDGSWFHINGMYLWAESGGQLHAPKIYGNVIGPDMGNASHITGWIFLSGNVTNPLVYNNVLFASQGGASNGFVSIGCGSGQVCYNATIVGNTFAAINNTVAAIGMRLGINNSVIKNNIFSNMSNAIYAGDPGGDYNITSDYNLFYGTGFYSSDFLKLNGNYYSINNWQAQLGLDNHSSSDTTQNPQFVDPDNYDFHLNAGSPAISSAEDLSAFYTVDKDNKSRPQGGGWDIGAYEYIDVSTTAPSVNETTQITNESAVLHWTTIDATTELVNYGTTLVEGNVIYNSAYSTNHTFPLVNLLNNMKYYFNITACNASLNCSTAGPYEFTTHRTLIFNINTSEWNLSGTTNLSKYDELELANISGVNFSNTYGAISYTTNLSLTQTRNLSNLIKVLPLQISVNSTQLPEFNRSANLIFRNVTLSHPIIKHDGNDCLNTSGICTNQSFNSTANLFTALVSGFSTYTLVEQCSDGIKNYDETGVDCGGANCAACPSAPSGPSGGSSGGGGGAGGGIASVTPTLNSNATNSTTNIDASGKKDLQNNSLRNLHASTNQNANQTAQTVYPQSDNLATKYNFKSLSTILLSLLIGSGLIYAGAVYSSRFVQSARLAKQKSLKSTQVSSQIQISDSAKTDAAQIFANAPPYILQMAQHLEKYLAAGYSSQQLVTMCVQKGWQKEVIVQILQKMNQVSPVNQISRVRN